MTRNQTRTRRISACHLHPDDPVAGICATCLRERLKGLDPLGDTEPYSSLVNASAGAGSISGNAAFPKLRRSRSVSAPRFHVCAEPRRMSCDSRPRNGKTLENLFHIADDCDGSDPDFVIESKKILGEVVNEVIEENDTRDRREDVNLASALLVDGLSDHKGNDEGGGGEEEDSKTMKEYIDLELQSKNQKKEFKELAGNIREAASVFSKKLQKWKKKQKVKKPSHSNDPRVNGGNGEASGSKGRKFGNTQSEASDYALGRRSCDTEPRFSVDAGRLSVDGGFIQFDEPRASWDGYMIARTIPTLTPMFSAIDNAILGSKSRFDNHRLTVDGLMHSIMEDDSSSGGSGQSNSDSSTSQGLSSFDRSSSVRSFGKKMVGLDSYEMKNPGESPAKLVITERELKDWHLKSVKNDQIEKLSICQDTPLAVENAVKIKSKKSVSWRKVLNVFSLKQKSHQTKCHNSMGGAVDGLDIDARENQQKEVSGEVKDPIGWGLTRSNSIVSARRSFDVMGSNNRRKSCSYNPGPGCASIVKEDFVLDGTQNVRYGSNNVAAGPEPFYLTPLRSSRSRRYERNKLKD